MGLTEKKIPPILIGSTETTVYTATAKFHIRDMHIVNTGSTRCWVNIWLVPSGGSSGNDNKLFHQVDIDKEAPPLHWDGHAILDIGDKIIAQGEYNNQLTLHVFGADIT